MVGRLQRLAMTARTGSDSDDGVGLRNTLRGKFFYLLVVIVVLLVSYPYVGRGIAGRIIINALNLVVLALAIFAIQRSRRQLAIMIALAAPTLAGQGVYLATGSVPAMRVAAVSLLAFDLFTIVKILLYVLRGGEVTADKIHGAICAYLLLSLMWATAYVLVESLQPGSFAATMVYDPGGRLDFYALLYFSIVTLTTAGYGDIVPVTTYARSLANLEQLVGVFYVAILIARLAGLYPPRGTRAPKRDNVYQTGPLCPARRIAVGA